MKRKRWRIVGAVLVALLAATGSWAWMNRMPDDATLRQMLVGCWVEDSAAATKEAIKLNDDGVQSVVFRSEGAGHPMGYTSTELFTLRWSIVDGCLNIRRASNDVTIRSWRIVSATPDRIGMRNHRYFDLSSISGIIRTWQRAWNNPEVIYERRDKPIGMYPFP